MSEKTTMPKNVQAFVDKYGRIGSKEQDAAFWKEFRKAANAYANVQAKRICDLEHALAETRGQRDRLAEALRKLAECDWVITPHDRMDAVREIARNALQSLSPKP